MKTTQILERTFLGKKVRQNHKTDFFCINDITKIGNEYRKNLGLSESKWSRYKEAKKSKEFFESLMKQDKLVEIFKVDRGKNAKTWAHPLVFFDYATWLNPDFKVWTYKWLYDSLTVFRDNSGESYKKMCGVLINTQDYTMSHGAVMIQKLAKAIKRDLGVDNWNRATTEQLELRDKIHNNMIFALELGVSPVKSYKTIQGKYNLNNSKELVK